MEPQTLHEAPHRVAAMRALAATFPIGDMKTEFEIWIGGRYAHSPQSLYVIVLTDTKSIARWAEERFEEEGKCWGSVPTLKVVRSGLKPPTWLRTPWAAASSSGESLTEKFEAEGLCEMWRAAVHRRLRVCSRDVKFVAVRKAVCFSVQTCGCFARAIASLRCASAIEMLRATPHSWSSR